MANIGPNESATFIAIVTDAKGVGNLAGGQLIDDTGATYAPFGAGADKSTFTATVDWAGINRTRSIDFQPGAGTRQFVAKFFDNDGNTANASRALGFDCGSQGACDGVCYDTTTDPSHCGACKVCPKGQTCTASLCQGLPLHAGPTSQRTACASQSMFSAPSSCVDVCGATATPTCSSPSTTIDDGTRRFSDPACTTEITPGPCGTPTSPFFECDCK